MYPTSQLNVLKYFSFLFLLFFFFSYNLFGQTYIKSLRWGGGDLISFPVIDSAKGITDLVIDFDIKSESYPELSIVFKFCDGNWNPYSSVFLQAQGNDIFTQLNYDRLPSSVEGADYHFRGRFPNEEIVFPFSGKWMFFITSLYDTSDIFDWGEFFVVHHSNKVSAAVKKMSMEGILSDNTALDRVYEMRIDVELNENQNLMWLDGVEIVENRKLKYPVKIDRKLGTPYKYYEMNSVDNFTFVWKNLHPGNEYREIDFRNENQFPKENVPVNFHRVETERFYKFGRRDLNGSQKLKDFNNAYSDYLDVQFNLRVPDGWEKDIYLVGAFNYWEISPWYKLKIEKGIHRIVLELKRGVYDYQYVTVPENGDINNADWLELEGNFWETSNEYHIFVNYNSQENGGYNKIIAHYKLKLN